MNHLSSLWTKKVGFFVLALVIGIIIGRFVLYHSAPSVPIDEHMRPTPATTTPSHTTTNSTVTAPVNPSTPAPAESSQCAADIKKELKESQTSYEAGTILVSFVANVSYDSAKSELAQYGFRVENEVAAQNSYPSNRLLTALVPAGQEINKVCLVRKNALVRYAGLNTYFDLHE
jgi:beta-lactam-binding protein with PASTA domain